MSQHLKNIKEDVLNTLQQEAVSLIDLIHCAHWIFIKFRFSCKLWHITSHLTAEMGSIDLKHGKSGIILDSSHKLSRYTRFHVPVSELVCVSFLKPYTHTYHHTKFQKLVTKWTSLPLYGIFLPCYDNASTVAKLVRIRHSQFKFTLVYVLMQKRLARLDAVLFAFILHELLWNGSKWFINCSRNELMYFIMLCHSSGVLQWHVAFLFVFWCRYLFDIIHYRSSSCKSLFSVTVQDNGHSGQ